MQVLLGTVVSFGMGLLLIAAKPRVSINGWRVVCSISIVAIRFGPRCSSLALLSRRAHHNESPSKLKHPLLLPLYRNAMHNALALCSGRQIEELKCLEQ